jgi:small nuclear ribonucleoprotein (snRNP)-like protein
MGWWGGNYPVRRSVLVNLKTGKDFKGVLWEQDRRYLVLRNASLLRSRETPVPMDGEVVIPLENVEFLQVLGA